MTGITHDLLFVLLWKMLLRTMTLIAAIKKKDLLGSEEIMWNMATFAIDTVNNFLARQPVHIV